MIAVVVADDGLHFRVMAHEAETGEVLEVTDQYVLTPMAIKTPEGQDVIGFHVGYKKDDGETLDGE